MEILKNGDILWKLIKFKIDLIVWKFMQFVPEKLIDNGLK